MIYKIAHKKVSVVFIVLKVLSGPKDHFCCSAADNSEEGEKNVTEKYFLI